jgi:branched-chain amino acid transport system ATP-binding protein
MAFLTVEDISLSFAGIRALDGVSLRVEKGQIAAVIGPNGAGKSSLFNCISGFYLPDDGAVTFDGLSVLGLPPHEIATRGLARTFQNLGLFPYLTVLENMLLGRQRHYQSGLFSNLFFSPQARRQEVAHRKKAEEIIEFLSLERYRQMPVGILPYGVLKRVELGRALCTEPQLLLLDEPAAGLNHEATEDLARFILDIKEELGITQVLIEHDLRFVLELADRITVLDFGKMVTEGSPDEVRVHPGVVEAYTGRGAEETAHG